MQIKGTFYWCYFNKQNPMAEKYTFDLGNLSDAAVAALQELGIKVANKEDRGNYLTFKSTRPIEVVDEAGDIISDRDGVAKKLVSNGSKGIVTVGYYDWEFKGKKGRSPSAKKVVITDLVEYKKEDDSIPV